IATITTDGTDLMRCVPAVARTQFHEAAEAGKSARGKFSAIKSDGSPLREGRNLRAFPRPLRRGPGGGAERGLCTFASIFASPAPHPPPVKGGGDLMEVLCCMRVSLRPERALPPALLGRLRRLGRFRVELGWLGFGMTCRRFRHALDGFTDRRRRTRGVAAEAPVGR